MSDQNIFIEKNTKDHKIMQRRLDGKCNGEIFIINQSAILVKQKKKTLKRKTIEN